MTSRSDVVLDDVSISCQYISKRVIVDKCRARHIAWVRETTLYARLIVICSSSSYMAAALKRLTVQLEYFDGLVVSTHLIKLGCIRVTSGSDPHYYPGQWVIRVSDGDPVATPLQTPHNLRCP